MTRLLLALSLCCCGAPAQSLEVPGSFRGYKGLTPQNGKHPGPKGVSKVVLLVEGKAALPLSCYDPLWVRQRGPEDCADLIPPGAELLGAEVIDRGPFKCGGRRGVRLKLSASLGARRLIEWQEGVGVLSTPIKAIQLEGGAARGPAPLKAWACLDLAAP